MSENWLMFGGPEDYRDGVPMRGHTITYPSEPPPRSDEPNYPHAAPSYPAAPQESERDRALSAIAAIRRAFEALSAIDFRRALDEIDEEVAALRKLDKPDE